MLERILETYTFTTLAHLKVRHCLLDLRMEREYGSDAIEGQTVTLLETKKSLVKRSIDQLSYIKDINSLIVLSGALCLFLWWTTASSATSPFPDMTVTLFPLPGFAPSTPLVKAKAAFSFSVHTCVQHPVHSPDSEKDSASDPMPICTSDNAKAMQQIPSIVTQLLIGCRRKVVIYSWKDGEAQEVKVRRPSKPLSERIYV